MNLIFGSTRPLLLLSPSYLSLILSESNQCSPYVPYENVLKTELDLFSIFLNASIIQHPSVSLKNSKSNC